MPENVVSLTGDRTYKLGSLVKPISGGHAMTVVEHTPEGNVCSYKTPSHEEVKATYRDEELNPVVLL